MMAVATGTWNIDAPVNFFASATYVVNGKRVELPAEVAGEKITGEFRGDTTWRNWSRG